MRKIFLSYMLLFFIVLACTTPTQNLPNDDGTNTNQSEEKKSSDTTPPAIVTEMKALTGNGFVYLSWKNPEDNDLDHVEIIITPTVNNYTSPIIVPKNENSIKIEKLMNKTVYTFKIVSVDASGNYSAEALITTTPDGENPTINISTSSEYHTNSKAIPLTIEFSENVSELNSAVFVITNGSIKDFSLNNDHTYSLILIPQKEGIVSLTIPDAAVHDVSSNPSLETQMIFEFNNTPPELDIKKKSSDFVNDLNITFTLTFSKRVTGFDKNVIFVTNGTLSELLTDDNISFIAKITAIDEGVVAISVPENKIKDIYGNYNSASQASVIYDKTNPVVTFSYLKSSSINYSPVTFTATFSEEVKNFSKEDISITGGVASNITTTDNIRFLINIIPNDRNVSFQISTDSLIDLAGNFNLKSEVVSFIFDSDEPTTSLTSEMTFPTNSTILSFNVTYSEIVTGFVNTDIKIQNGTIKDFSGDGKNYTFSITPLSDGDVILYVPEKTAFDVGGNGNFESNKLTIQYDSTPPQNPVITTLEETTENLTPEWTWSVPEDAVNFSYRLDDSEWIYVETDTTSFKPSTNLSLGDHVLEIRAKDNVGNWSQIEKKSINIILATPLLNSFAESFSNQITIFWENNTTSSSGCIVEVRKEGESFVELIRYQSAYTSYAHSNLNPDTLYSYRVKLFNAGGDSEYSNIIEVRTKPVLIAPANLTAEVVFENGDGYVNLNWKDNSDSEYKYVIYFKPVTGSTWESEEVSRNVTNTKLYYYRFEHHDSTFYEMATDYEIKVMAQRSESDVSAFSNITTVHLPEKINAPGNFKGMLISDNAIQLSWNDMATNEISYVIKRLKVLSNPYNPDDYIEIARLSANSTEYIDSNVEAGFSYLYKIYASGNMNKSNVERKYSSLSIPVVIKSFGEWVEAFTPSYFTGTLFVIYNKGMAENNYKFFIDDSVTNPANYNFSVEYAYGGAEITGYMSNSTYYDPAISNKSLYFPANTEKVYLHIRNKKTTDPAGKFAIKFESRVLYDIYMEGGGYLYNSDELDCGDADIDFSEIITKTIFIKNKGEGNLKILDIGLGYSTLQEIAPFSINTTSMITSIPPGGTTSFNVSFFPDSLGSFTNNLLIDFEDLFDGHSEKIIIRTAGNGVADLPEMSVHKSNEFLVSDNISVVDFGAVAVNDTKSISLYVHNSGNLDLNLTGTPIISASAPFDVETTFLSSVIPAHTTINYYEFSVYFKPTESGVFSQTIIIPSDDPYHPAYKIQVTGYAPGPRFSASSSTTELNHLDSVEMGKMFQNVNGDNYSLTITNTSNYTLVISDISLSNNTDFQIIGSTSMNIIPSSSTTLNVLFSPQNIGNLESTLTIKSNSEDIKNFSIVLKGTSLAGNQIPLDGNWHAGNIYSYYNNNWCYFYVEAGKKYDIFWDDVVGSGYYDSFIKISGYNDSFINSYFSDRNNGYNTPVNVTATSSGFIALKIETRYMSNIHCGSYAIKVIEKP